MIEAAVIGGIIGAVGTAITVVIKAAKQRNENKKDQLNHEENLLKIATTMNGVNSALKDFKAVMDKGFDDINEKIQNFKFEQDACNIALMRHNITQTYEDWKEKDGIPKIVYESVLSLYDNYKKYGGNSFVDEEIEEIKGWGKF